VLGGARRLDGAEGHVMVGHEEAFRETNDPVAPTLTMAKIRLGRSGAKISSGAIASPSSEGRAWPARK